MFLQMGFLLNWYKFGGQYFCKVKGHEPHIRILYGPKIQSLYRIPCPLNIWPYYPECGPKLFKPTWTPTVGKLIAQNIKTQSKGHYSTYFLGSRSRVGLMHHQMAREQGKLSWVQVPRCPEDLDTLFKDLRLQRQSVMDFGTPKPWVSSAN